MTDHEVTLSDGHHLHRQGRFHRFFQYLSLFCFSMLGIVIAGNIAMVFVFWELVGICSYFLIGFYIERKSASTAANKAFIVNRVGDFGMIIGLMALFGSLGTFAFGDIDTQRQRQDRPSEHGIFSQVRPPTEAIITWSRPTACCRPWPPTRSPHGVRADDRAIGRLARGFQPARHRPQGLLAVGRGRAGNFLRLRRQKCAVSAARLVARRHGRPHAGQRAGPFGDDGGGGRLSGGPVLPGVRARGAAGDRHRRLHHAVHRGHDRDHGHRHQARAGLFDGQPVGLHDAGPGRRRLGGRHVSPDHARVFQKPAVHVLRLGDPRLPHERHDEDGRPAAENALDRLHDAGRLPGDHRRRRAVFDRAQRPLLEGRDPGPGAVVQGQQSALRLVVLSWRPAVRRSPRSTCSACGI